MNAEKFVKQEARQRLSGHWVRMIAGLLTSLLVPLIAVLIMEIAFSFLSGSDYPSYIGFFLLFMLIAVAEIILFLPITNGLTRMFCALADKGTADVNDLFYFFETKRRYFAALKFSLTIFFRCLLAAVVCSIPAGVCACVSEYIYRKNFARSESLTLVNTLDVCTVVLAVIGVAALVVFSLRYLFASSLFSYYGYSGTQSLAAGSAAAKRATKPLVRLTVTFIPWVLLLFFVVPFLYVLPYMICSYSVSVKYLLTSLGFKLVGGADCTYTPPQNNYSSDDTAANTSQVNSPANGDTTSSSQIFTEVNEPDKDAQQTDSVTFTSPLEDNVTQSADNAQTNTDNNSNNNTAINTEDTSQNTDTANTSNTDNGKAHE